MGATAVGDGRILPYVDIFCDAVRMVLAYELDIMAPDAREVAYGRALARVLAHELYHVLANDLGHGPGVSNRYFSSGTLVASSFHFESKEIQTLRATLIPVLLSCYPKLADRRDDLEVFVAGGCSSCHSPSGEATPLYSGEKPEGDVAKTLHRKGESPRQVFEGPR